MDPIKNYTCFNISENTVQTITIEDTNDKTKKRIHISGKLTELKQHIAKNELIFLKTAYKIEKFANVIDLNESIKNSKTLVNQFKAIFESTFFCKCVITFLKFFKWTETAKFYKTYNETLKLIEERKAALSLLKIFQSNSDDYYQSIIKTKEESTNKLNDELSSANQKVQELQNSLSVSENKIKELQELAAKTDLYAEEIRKLQETNSKQKIEIEQWKTKVLALENNLKEETTQNNKSKERIKELARLNNARFVVNRGSNIDLAQVLETMEERQPMLDKTAKIAEEVNNTAIKEAAKEMANEQILKLKTEGAEEVPEAPVLTQAIINEYNSDSVTKSTKTNLDNKRYKKINLRVGKIKDGVVILNKTEATDNRTRSSSNALNSSLKLAMGKYRQFVGPEETNDTEDTDSDDWE